MHSILKVKHPFVIQNPWLLLVCENYLLRGRDSHYNLHCINLTIKNKSIQNVTYVTSTFYSFDFMYVFWKQQHTWTCSHLAIKSDSDCTSKQQWTAPPSVEMIILHLTSRCRQWKANKTVLRGSVLFCLYWSTYHALVFKDNDIT